MFRRSAGASLLLLAALSGAASADQLAVVSLSPAARSVGAATNASIAVTFDRPVKRSSVDSNSFWAFGRWSGTASGAYAFSNSDQTVTLTPEQPFSAGETVMVILSHDLQAADN